MTDQPLPSFAAAQARLREAGGALWQVGQTVPAGAPVLGRDSHGWHPLSGGLVLSEYVRPTDAELTAHSADTVELRLLSHGPLMVLLTRFGERWTDAPTGWVDEDRGTTAQTWRDYAAEVLPADRDAGAGFSFVVVDAATNRVAHMRQVGAGRTFSAVLRRMVLGVADHGPMSRDRYTAVAQHYLDTYRTPDDAADAAEVAYVSGTRG